MSSRYYNDFLSAYLKYAEETEPPKTYHTWVALSLIAACLQRRVYIKWGMETIYPNMYIVLVGPSGRCRKGTALNIGRDLLKDIGSVSLASDSVTREALIRRMGEAIDSFVDPKTREVSYHCALTAFSPELHVFLGENNVKFLADLTDWYDANDAWVYETKGSGTDQIQGLCFNLLGATAPDWFSSILPQEAVGGGFTSRIIFVVEERKEKTVGKFTLSEEMKQVRNKLFSDLETISTISGMYEFDTHAENTYIQWYEKEDAKMMEGRMPIEDPRFAGYCERRGTHVRKLSMLLAASQRDELVIMKPDVTRSIQLLRNVELKMHMAFGGLGQSSYSDATEAILKYIKQRRKVTRSDLMLRFYRDIDGATLKAIEEVLGYMKIVKIIRDIDNNETLYEYIGQ